MSHEINTRFYEGCVWGLIVWFDVRSQRIYRERSFSEGFVICFYGKLGAGKSSIVDQFFTRYYTDTVGISNFRRGKHTYPSVEFDVVIFSEVWIMAD